MNQDSNSNGKINTYRYREHPEVKDLAAAIGEVLTHVQKTTGHLPFVLFVPPKQATEAQRVVDLVKSELGAEISVQAVGGCLLGEVWWADGSGSHGHE